MSVTVASLGLDKLSVEERIALANELWESVEAERLPSPLTPAQAEELDRRIAEVDANPNDVFTWDEVKAEVRTRCNLSEQPSMLVGSPLPPGADSARGACGLPTSMLTESQLAELRCRVKDAELHPEDGIPWEEVKAKGRLRIGERRS